jgi:hypothetical protein
VGEMAQWTKGPRAVHNNRAERRITNFNVACAVCVMLEACAADAQVG